MKGQQSKNLIQKQSKSSERPQKGTKAHGIASYSPFQNRLYHQYQSSIPANQASYSGNNATQSTNSNVPKDNQFYNYMISNYKDDVSYCTSEPHLTMAGGSMSHDISKDYCAQQTTQISACSPSVCLQHPQVIEQTRKEQNQRNGQSHR